MLFRNKKSNDPNEGKWLGVGGKFEPGENAEECLVREVREETGFELESFVFHGVIEFRNDSCEDEDMYLFTAVPSVEGMPVPDCSEGRLQWIDKTQIMRLNLWEGDRCFLEPLIEGGADVSMRLVYSKDRLVEVIRH